MTTLIPLLTLLVGCPVQAHTEVPQMVQMNEGETSEAVLKGATIRIAPNQLKQAGIDFEEYEPALRAFLTEYWTEAVFKIEISDKDSNGVGEILDISLSGDQEDIHEVLFDAVGDHFFDEYPASR